MITLRGLARYATDEDWIVPHFEKMLYDNSQFVLLLSKYCKINNDNYYKYKLKQTIEFLKNDFVNERGFLGSAYDADSDGEEGKYYVFTYEEVKNLNNINKYFDIKPEEIGKKIILVEKEKPPVEIIKKLLKIRSKRKKPFFDDKTQLDLNCLWISSLLMQMMFYLTRGI